MWGSYKTWEASKGKRVSATDGISSKTKNQPQLRESNLELSSDDLVGLADPWTGAWVVYGQPMSELKQAEI
ncbi:hypothetical protein DSO57_1005296 [Entomophthora muscae]|uniref:Uncharacterized protein n=1 Tax=Entomophthora muscae TaxID=34485 RepID=A0ACC2TIY7_9FUNG|nr:hypothetical protein DSO57_1005296 [Entomophthora muscae]